jgi:hypothetical protein
MKTAVGSLGDYLGRFLKLLALLGSVVGGIKILVEILRRLFP